MNNSNEVSMSVNIRQLVGLAVGAILLATILVAINSTVLLQSTTVASTAISADHTEDLLSKLKDIKGESTDDEHATWLNLT
jgi:hypothetical protein